MKRSVILAVFMGSLIFPSTLEATANPPIHFIRNKNQWPSEINFMANVSGGNMLLEAGRFRYHFLDGKKREQLHKAGHDSFDESTFSLSQGDDIINGQLVDVNFLGSNRFCLLESVGELPFYYNFFVGKDEGNWASKVEAFEGVLYHSIYNGIDLKVYSQGNTVKYDWIVKPGADAAQIRSQYLGGEPLQIINGELLIETPVVKIKERKPLAFQWIDGKQKFIKCNYSLQNNIVYFEFPDGYDSCFELVIDPLLIFSTYSGSTADNWGSTATPGERGTLYSSGVTSPFNFGGSFPATAGAFQTVYGGLYDISILKYDSTGQNLLYASYLGGSDSESPHSLVMNSNEELIVLGTTSSLDFPTTFGAFDRDFNGGRYEENVISYTHGSDIFVAKISKDGSQLIASTYLGGSENDGLNPSTGILVKNYGDQLRGDVITDDHGNIFVSSVSSSANFPTENSFNTTYQGGSTDGILLKLSPTLSQLTWGAFLGGEGADASHTIKLDQSNIIYVAGGTSSDDFPTTSSAYQTAHNGNADGWIAKIASDGSSLLASTFTGTSSFNQIYFLDLNKQGDVYVYGQTVGPFPVTAGTYSNTNSGQFIQKFNNHLDTLLFSTVFGSGRGIPDISPTAFLVNDCNNLFMSGWGGEVNQKTNHWNSNTIGMPVTADAYQKTTSGSDFYFIVLTEDASQFLYGTYLGGTQSRTHVDGGTSRFDKSGVVYHAVCSGCEAFNATTHSTSDFPTTPNAWSQVNLSVNCNNAAFKFDLSSLKARIQTNNVQLTKPGYNTVCFPDEIVFQNLSTGGEIYLWDFGDGTTEIKTDILAITHQYQGSGEYKVKLKAIDQGTCIGKDSTYATVNVYQPFGYASEDQSICFGSSAQLTAGGGILYEWSSKDGKFQSTMMNPIVKPDETSMYFVSVTDVHGCLKKDTVLVSVVPGIDLRYEWKKVFPDCFSRPSLEVINRTDPGEEIYFDFGDGTGSDLDEVAHHYETDSIYTVRIIGRKDFCVYEKGDEIPIYSVKVPNVITPDQSPGKNDTFKILLNDQPISTGGVKTSLVIFNRWGEEIFAANDYKDNWSGEGLAAGVYYFEAKILQENLTCKGWVQLIR